MKSLEIKELEGLEGGLDCETGLGAGAVVAAGAFALAFFATGPLGFNVAIELTHGSLISAVSNCAN